MNRNCLCCQKPLDNGAHHHPKCLKDLFGKPTVPAIPFGLADIPAQVVKTGARMSIPGVQMKLSVRINPDTWTLETVAEGGTYILKPDPTQYPELPQNENLCMNMAAELNMPVPPHGLFPMSDGKLCYIIKRFDRLDDGTKLQKETMFQILGSEDKYRGSLEQVGKVIRKHAANVGLDSIDFFERAFLCFLIGNGDMHLKNWALLTDKEGRISFAPCYDFVSSKVYLPEEADSALTINGKQNKLSRPDFEALAAFLKIDPKSMSSSFQKLLGAKKMLLQMCASSELSTVQQHKLTDIIESRHAAV
ncbi:MAG: HipA domain-containing protein [Elusimicrobia bacterium]|nr:HipA domain-containing protein [Elusimicrobiota bacterium]